MLANRYVRYFALLIFILFVFGLGLFFILRSSRLTPHFSYPTISLRSKTVSYGFTKDLVYVSPAFTGVISNIQIQNNVLILSIRDPNSDDKILPQANIFHFGHFVLITDLTISNPTTTVWTAYPADQANKILKIGKYVSIQFDPNSVTKSSSDILNNEANINKNIVVYEYVH